MFYKDARFWISVLALGMVGAMALLGKVGGDAALGAVLGVAGGWGLGRAGGAKAVGLLIPLVAIAASACATMPSLPPEVTAAAKCAGKVKACTECCKPAVRCLKEAAGD